MATYSNSNSNHNSNYSNYNYDYIRTWEERQMATYLSVAIADIERDEMITNTAWILFSVYIICSPFSYCLLILLLLLFIIILSYFIFILRGTR